MTLFVRSNAIYSSQINSSSVFASIKKVGKPLNIVPNNYPPIKELFPGNKSEDIMFNTIKPLFCLLRAMSALPLQFSSNGKKEFKFASPVMVYSIILFTTMMVNIFGLPNFCC